MRDYDFIQKIATDPNGTLSYVESNTNSMKPKTILLIHGISANWRDWNTSMLDEISMLGYRTIAIDRPGMGESDRRSEVISLEDQASLIMRVIRLLDSRPLLIMGHSYGGSLALKMALNYPNDISGLILLAAPTHPWVGGLGLLYDILGFPLFTKIGTKFISLCKPERLINSTLIDIFCPQKIPTNYREELNIELTLRQKSLEWIIKDAKMLKASLAKMSENYKNLNIPIEIFHGTSDKIVPLELHAKKFHEKVFSSKLTKLNGIGHMPHHFRKNIILQSIVSLLVKR